MRNYYPCIWKILHIFCATHKINDSVFNTDELDYFLSSIVRLIPDVEYSRKMVKFMTNEPIEQYQDSLPYWGFLFDNYVNPEKKLVYEHIQQLYTIDNITKPFWGKPLWLLIHWLASVYERKNFMHFKAFIFSLTFLMPCPKCKKHLRENLSKTGLYIDSYAENNLTMFIFTFNLHNVVNKAVGNPLQNYDQMTKKYNLQ